MSNTYRQGVMGGLAGLLSFLITPAAMAQGAIEALPGCGSSALARSDDGSSAAIPLGFSIQFGASHYASVFINTNGNLTFGGALAAYTPMPLGSSGLPIIAPFFADVDTTVASSDVVRYGRTVFGGRPAFCVSWSGVGVSFYGSTVDRLNNFQALIVDRSDSGSGNFDLIFNYGRIEWESGMNSGGIDGLGGNSARIGWSDGAGGSFELAGSGVAGSFLDGAETALIAGSRDSVQLGRYRFELRSGTAAAGGTAAGTLRDPNNGTVAGAYVACCVWSAPNAWSLPCQSGFTDASGHFAISGITDGSRRCVAYAPAGSGWFNNVSVPFTVSGGNLTSELDIRFIAPLGMPYDTELYPSTLGADRVPTISWDTPTYLLANACFGQGGGTASYSVVQDGVTITTAPMAERWGGAFYALVPALRPLHGQVQFQIELTCPGGQSGSHAFDAMLDPGGRVRDADGAPVEGAQLTLLRADSIIGPFVAVPTGSAILAAPNRNNPTLTSATGHFAWTPVKGYYIIRAEKEGCSTAETGIISVPQEWAGLEITLECGGDEVPPVITFPSDLAVEATGPDGAAAIFDASAVDETDGPVAVSCSHASGATFALGSTVVTCTAADQAGNVAEGSFAVHVLDTTAPSLSLPGALSTVAASAGGSIVAFSTSAFDLVGGSIAVSCSPASGSLFAPGRTTVQCSAADASGNTASGSFTVDVAFAWSGLLQPISRDGTSVFKLGRTIPVKFQLSGQSAGIGDATAALWIAKISSAVTGVQEEATSTSQASSGNLFRYDAGSDQYVFNLSTSAMSEGTWELYVDLGDGVTRATRISIKR